MTQNKSETAGETVETAMDMSISEAADEKPTKTTPKKAPKIEEKSPQKEGEGAGEDGWGAEVELESAIGVKAEEAAEYRRKQRRFRHLMERGVEPGAWIVVEVDIHEAAQIPSGVNRCDLVETFEALGAEPELAPLINLGLGSEMELEALDAAGWAVVHDEATETVLHATIEGNREWSEHLGGRARDGEIERRFEIVVRRAPWRDRKIRRLSKINVVSVQIHPDPEKSDL